MNKVCILSCDKLVPIRYLVNVIGIRTLHRYDVGYPYESDSNYVLYRISKTYKF